MIGRVQVVTMGDCPEIVMFRVVLTGWFASTWNVLQSCKKGAGIVFRSRLTQFLMVGCLVFVTFKFLSEHFMFSWDIRAAENSPFAELQTQGPIQTLKNMYDPVGVEVKLSEQEGGNG